MLDDLLQHRDPVQAWEEQIEDHQVVTAGTEELDPTPAVAGLVDLETGGHQRTHDEVADPGLVLNDQDPRHTMRSVGRKGYRD